MKANSIQSHAAPVLTASPQASGCAGFTPAPAFLQPLPAARAGFSLVEVLIAIFVLSLGLLGVAAVFPAVVRQQRQASDTIQGISMQRSVEDLLRGNSRLNEPNTQAASQGGVQSSVARGWSLMLADDGFSARGGWSSANRLTGGSASAPGFSLNFTTGEMLIGGGTTLMDDEVQPIRLTMNERLIPRPSQGSSVQPRFVWDFIARRIPAGQTPLVSATNAVNAERYFDDSVQLAIFIRRIDPGIRIPADTTLAKLLAGNLAGDRPQILAIADDGQRRPTFDGRGGDTLNYSPIRHMSVRIAEDSNGQPELGFILSPEMPNRSYVEQIGQKFVDALGIVHEVIAIDRDVPTGTPARLKLQPAIEPRLAINGGAVRNFDLYYTPQVPASVSVITIRR